MKPIISMDLTVFVSENVDLTTAIFTDDPKMSEASLKGANLENLNFPGINLWKADLQGANLKNTNLSSADMERANLQDADLEGANLDAAILKDAVLEGANISAEQREQACWSDCRD